MKIEHIDTATIHIHPASPVKPQQIPDEKLKFMGEKFALAINDPDNYYHGQAKKMAEDKAISIEHALIKLLSESYDEIMNL